MRIRSIRPEFWSSEDVAALDWETRLVFIGLWSYVDDNGVGRDVEKLVAAELFPLDDDPRETLARVSDGLARLSERGLISRYEVCGKRYLHITTWAKHQKIDRPGKDRYPPPTSENATPRESVATVSRDHRETPSTGEGEKGRREELPCPVSDTDERTDERTDDRTDGFAEFYAAYPRKEARRKAEQAWRAALKRTDRQTIMAGLARFEFKPERQFQPLPASWLNADRWADEAEPAAARAHGPPWERFDDNVPNIHRAIPPWEDFR